MRHYRWPFRKAHASWIPGRQRASPGIVKIGPSLSVLNTQTHSEDAAAETYTKICAYSSAYIIYIYIYIHIWYPILVTLHCNALPYITLPYITLQHLTVHYSTLQFITRAFVCICVYRYKDTPVHVCVKFKYIPTSM